MVWWWGGGEEGACLDNALQLVVVADLDEAREREVFSEGVSLEAVVGEDASEVGVVGEVHPKHVPDLTLVPVRRLHKQTNIPLYHFII